MEAREIYDAIIIGSGLSAISAVLKLKPMRVLMLDVGLKTPTSELPEENIYLARKKGADLFRGLIGPSYETLEGVSNYISPKLKGPQMRHVWQHSNAAPQDYLSNFDAVISYARGGLATAWGAGAFRYNDEELQQFPITIKDLDPYYEELTRHIGITGEDDDLTPFLGSCNDLLPPLPLSPLAYSFFKKYKQKKIKKNTFVGRARLAVLSRNYRGRPAYRPFLQDFFQSYNHSIYNPSFTLQELCEEGAVDYRPGFLVTRFIEKSNIVTVVAKNLTNNTEKRFHAKSLFIGAGTINTARIVLQSFDDYITKLPLLDNPVAFIPFLDLSKVGKKFPENVFPGAELIVVHNDENYSEPVQASVYGLYGPMRSDLIAELPLSLRSNIPAVKYLGAAMGMLQVFFPDKVSPSNYLQLQKDGSLEICHAIEKKKKYLERSSQYSIFPFLKLLQHMGYLAFSCLCKFPIAGSSIHYAGSLPMKKAPQKIYETEANGKLFQSNSVYIIDAATFPYLPSKNHSFTMMANAMRIADCAKNNLS